MEFRFLDTGKNTPYMNMAIDEALLASNSPVLRFYQWLPPAISIGFSQSMSREINIAECHKQGIGYVRRLTGGKAVFHESELTYSIILSAESVPESIVESYKMDILIMQYTQASALMSLPIMRLLLIAENLSALHKFARVIRFYNMALCLLMQTLRSSAHYLI